MKVIIVTIFFCIGWLLSDFFLEMMSARNTFENIMGLILLVILLVITVKTRFGLKPYNYLVSKINKSKTK